MKLVQDFIGENLPPVEKYLVSYLTWWLFAFAQGLYYLCYHILSFHPQMVADYPYSLHQNVPLSRPQDQIKKIKQIMLFI